VVIIDGAERLTEGAANAFLKTLEEPPPSTTVILVATGVQALPPTVRSRCHMVLFYPLEAPGLREVLARHLSGEDVGLAMEVAAGSPGRGLRMDRDVVALLKGYMAGASTTSWSDRLMLAESLHKDKDVGQLFLEQLALGIRDTIVARETGSRDGVPGERDKGDETEPSPSRRGTRELLDRFWFLTEVMRGLEYHANTRLSLEVALMGPEGVKRDEVSWN